MLLNQMNFLHMEKICHITLKSIQNLQRGLNNEEQPVNRDLVPFQNRWRDVSIKTKNNSLKWIQPIIAMKKPLAWRGEPPS